MEGDEEAYLPTEDILEEYDLEDAMRADSAEVGGEEEEGEGGLDDGVGYDSIIHPGLPPYATFTGHAPNEVYAVAFCGSVIISGGGDDRLYFYTLTPSAINVLFTAEHDDSVSCIAVQGQLVASGWMDGVVLIHRVLLGDKGVVEGVAQCGRLEGVEGEVMWIEWQSNGQLAVGGEDGTIWLWQVDLDTTTPDAHPFTLNVFTGNGQRSLCGVFTLDSSLLISGDEQGTLFIYGLAEGVLKRRIQVPDQAPITVLYIHPTLKIILFGTLTGSLYHYPLSAATTATPPTPYHHRHTDSVECIKWTSGNFITGSLDGSLHVHSDSNMVTRFNLSLGPDSGITCMQTLDDLVFIGCSDGRVCSYNVRTGHCNSSLQSNGAPCLDMVITRHQSGRLLATATAGGQVNIYQV